MEFDATLAERLKSMELPEALDRDSIRGTIPNCTCKCGHKHVAVAPRNSKPSRRTRDEYRRVKKILDSGKHPTFIGRQRVLVSTRNGGCTIFRYANRDIACEHRQPYEKRAAWSSMSTHATALTDLALRFCNTCKPTSHACWNPPFRFSSATAIQKSAELKRGNSLNTQVMIKSSLIPLAGRLCKLYANRDCMR